MNPVFAISTLIPLGLLTIPTTTGKTSPTVPSLPVVSPVQGGGGPLSNPIPVFLGKDTNSALNPFIQPQDRALAGNGRDQTQQFFDLLLGNPYGPGVIIGRLGVDVIIGGPSIDVIIGGPEHFNPNNRDKAFGLTGDDVFLWSPGDGSDRFDGGPGVDTIAFGLMGELDANNKLVFKVTNDQKAGNVFLDKNNYGLPRLDVTNSPGFCKVIDKSSSMNARHELEKIDVDHLVQFFIRSVNQDFKAGKQKTDNGLRVTLSLKSVEFLVCTSPNGGKIEAFDLRYAPPRQVPLSYVPQVARWIVR